MSELRNSAWKMKLIKIFAKAIATSSNSTSRSDDDERAVRERAAEFVQRPQQSECDDQEDHHLHGARAEVATHAHRHHRQKDARQRVADSVVDCVEGRHGRVGNGGRRDYRGVA